MHAELTMNPDPGKPDSLRIVADDGTEIAAAQAYIASPLAAGFVINARKALESLGYESTNSVWDTRGAVYTTPVKEWHRLAG